MSGLIFYLCNRDYKIIAKESKGQCTDSTFILGPRFLHYNLDNLKLLKKLNITAKEKTCSIGYYWHRELLDAHTDDMRREYFDKSRGVNNSVKLDISSLNEGITEFKYFDINFNTLCDQLFNIAKDDIINEEVIKIDYIKKKIYTTNIYEYDELIVTIPRKTFYSLIGYHTASRFLISKSVTFIKVTTTPIDMKDKNYIYIIDHEYPYYRITNYIEYYCVEMLGEIDEVECKKIFKDTYITSKIVKDSQLITLKSEIVLKNVKFLGRYGMHDKSLKIQDVVRSSQC